MILQYIVFSPCLSISLQILIIIYSAAIIFLMLVMRNYLLLCLLHSVSDCAFDTSAASQSGYQDVWQKTE